MKFFFAVILYFLINSNFLGAHELWLESHEYKLKNKEKIFILGAGSNTLVRDGGFNGMIVKLGKGFNKIILEKDLIKAGASILDLNLSKFAFLNSISNFEFYSGIPGTIGGAIKMNAGCYGNETKNVVKKISIITKTGKKKSLTKNCKRLAMPERH